MTSTVQTLSSSPSKKEHQDPSTLNQAELAPGVPHFSMPGADEGPFHHHLQLQDLEAGGGTSESSDDTCSQDERNIHHESSGHSHSFRTDHDKTWRKVHPFTAMKHILSLALTCFCVVVVSAAIFTKQTTATGEKNVHPVLAYIVFWGLILWLALMEGGLNCMVGLKPIDKSLYMNSHTRTYKCTTLAHHGDNLERFIVGRQYLDLMCVFLTSFMVSTVEDASVLGLPSIVNEIFLDAGVAVILVTIIFGQLIAQINAAHSMLDYMNNYVMLVITYVALAVEASGILHAVYLVQIFFSRISGKQIESNEPSKTTWQRVGFWARITLSVTILVVAFVVSFTALFQNNTTMWDGVPPAASVLLLFALIGITGIMEGLQIAFFAVAHLPAEQIERNASAKYNCDLVFRKSSTNLQAFLVGRQIFQTIVMFVIARIITVEMKEGEGNLFGVSDGMQAFFETGVLGALLSTIVASLSWRVLASSFPMVFLANPLSTLIIRFCLFVEWTGICYSSWFFACIHYRLARFQDDVSYIGSAATAQPNELKSDSQTQPGTPASSTASEETEEEGHDVFDPENGQPMSPVPPFVLGESHSES